MTDFFELIGRMLESGITWSTLVAAFVVYGQWQEKRHMRKMIYLIAKKVGVEWDTPQEELRKMVLLNYKRLSSLSHKEIIRRRMYMEKLKSRKLWLALLGAIIPVINNEFGLNLDAFTIGTITVSIITGIIALAHVDAKKILAGLVHTKVTVKGLEVAYTTFQEAIPYLKEIHADINDLLDAVKKDDGSQAFKDAMHAYAQIKPILDAIKHPKPVTVIVEDKVAS